MLCNNSEKLKSSIFYKSHNDFICVNQNFRLNFFI